MALAYGWGNPDLGHGFHQTKQGTRYTISEAARQEALGRRLSLNHRSSQQLGRQTATRHASAAAQPCAAAGLPVPGESAGWRHR